MSRDYLGIVDPIQFGKFLWPDVYFYSRQRDILYSVVEDDETVVVAANEMGKDFVAGFLVVYFLLTRHPVRVVTTSAKDDHLRVLWGEVNRFIQTAKHPLDAKRGGALIVNHQDIRKVYQSGPHKGQKCPISYAIGLVASPDSIAAMQGHHVADVGDGIPRTLFIADECSSVPHEYKKMANTWAARKLLIGNAWECHNFFRHAIEGDPKTGIKGGSIRRKKGTGYHRRVFQIPATESPNVRYALAQEEAGIEPTGKVLVPGVKTWGHYTRDLETMDDAQQCVSLRAEFYKGKDVMMFPTEWLQLSTRRAKDLRGLVRYAESMGIDPGEGSANTVWTIVDRLGIIKQISRKTPNTNEIIWDTIDLIEDYSILPERVFFDRGGGGKQIADVLREKGYDVQTVDFGGSVSSDAQGISSSDERRNRREEQSAYGNKRTQMYMYFRSLLDPNQVFSRSHLIEETVVEPHVFAIPEDQCGELLRQLSPIPLRRGEEGRIRMIPKNKRAGRSKEVTLEDLLGCSPDEADSTVLAVYGLSQEMQPITVGAI